MNKVMLKVRGSKQSLIPFICRQSQKLWPCDFQLCSSLFLPCNGACCYLNLFHENHGLSDKIIIWKFGVFFIVFREILREILYHLSVLPVPVLLYNVHLAQKYCSSVYCLVPILGLTGPALSVGQIIKRKNGWALACVLLLLNWFRLGMFLSLLFFSN